MNFFNNKKQIENPEKFMIIGSNSDIGSSIIKILHAKNKNVLGINRDIVDFDDLNAGSKVKKIISEYNPDIIINCVGVLGDNTCEYQKVFDANFKPNWEIVQHFMNNPTIKKIKFIMIGSSAYNEGRKNYMLYASSKAALYSLFLSISSMFHETNLLVGLINLPRVNTKMISNLVENTDKYLSSDDAAKIILEFTKNLKTNSCLNAGVK